MQRLLAVAEYLSPDNWRFGRYLEAAVLLPVVGASGWLKKQLGGAYEPYMLVGCAILGDIVTGLLAAWCQRRLSSSVGRRGFFRKLAMVLCLGLFYGLDRWFHSGHMWQLAGSYYLASIEFLSITENLALMGFPLPPKVLKALQVAQAKGLDQLNAALEAMTPGDDSSTKKERDQ